MTSQSIARCIALACLIASRTEAQKPTAPQARELQTMLQGSGLSLEQLRSRLKASGFSEGLLDAYYAGRSDAAPSQTVLEAIRALGLAPSDSVAEGQTPAAAPPTADVVDAVSKEFVESVTAAARDARMRSAIIDLIRTKGQQADGGQVFGIEVFRRANTLFDANDAGPVPPDYRIGPGDQLVLILTGDTERSFVLPVSREGVVFISNVGAVPVANLTMAQLEDLLFSRLGRVYSGIRRGPDATAHFQVSVSKLGANQVSVLGDVTTPGAYRISKLGTVLTALYAAGGPTSSGSMRRVEVHRAAKAVASLDLYDYLISGNASRDIKLESGDIVLVPPRGPQVRLLGGVLRPATYELKSGETLGDLIQMSGGLLPEADQRRVQVQRLLPPNQRTSSGSDRVLFDVSGASIEGSREPLLAGDIVEVSFVSSRLANRVEVSGNVWSPGAVATTPGMRLLDAIKRSGGVKSDTYFEALQLSRRKADSTRQILRLRVPEADGAFSDSANILLQPDDQIRVFSVSEYRPKRYVTVSGAVSRPGRIPFDEGMTVRDLLMLAGGLREGALLTAAEVARMPSDRKDGTTAVTISVPMDSSYVFDRWAGTPYPGPPGIAAPTVKAPEFELKAYDNVLILQQPDWFYPRVVTIQGEVQFPGIYTLRSKNERLSDLVTRAGGLTRDAYAEGIVFTRTQNEVGRIGVDLPAAMRRADHPDNLLLADGDVIEIPFYSAVVTITGAVNSPVAVAFVKSAKLDYYVYGAGGPTAQAALNKAFVRQPSGKVESRRRHVLWTSTPTPQPGSTIVVPERIAKERIDIASLLTVTTSVLTSVVALAAIFYR